MENDPVVPWDPCSRKKETITFHEKHTLHSDSRLLYEKKLDRKEMKIIADDFVSTNHFDTVLNFRDTEYILQKDCLFKAMQFLMIDMIW